ncbi:MAG: hypothetical protein EBZ77_08460 [Chitinophagia bacterium]|nr:hypothetical protein [Chitinophagia bacterium]
MKRIDFTIPGGFPLSQDRMQFLQESYIDAITALAGIGAAGDYILSGCELSGDDPTFTVSEGWIFYRGKLYYCPGGNVSTARGVDVGFQLTELDDATRTLVYANTTSQMPLSWVRAIPIEYGSGSPNTDEYFNIGQLERGRLPYDLYEAFGAQNTVTTDAGACTVYCELRAEKDGRTGVIKVGMNVNVTGANACTVTPPTRRFVDTGIDIPWAVTSCVPTPTKHLPISVTATGTTFLQQVDSAGKYYDFIQVQVIGTRVYLAFAKTASGDSFQRATGSFELIDATVW